MATKEKVSLGSLDCDNVIRIHVGTTQREWVWDSTGELETHDPMDRVGGPYRITDHVESDGELWFLFAVVDSYFPCRDLVRGDSLEHAYEQYIDWAAEHRHIKIDESDLKDYNQDDLQYDSNGNPVDTDNIVGDELKLIRLEFAQ